MSALRTTLRPLTSACLHRTLPYASSTLVLRPANDPRPRAHFCSSAARAMPTGEPTPGATATADMIVTPGDLASALSQSVDEQYPAVFGTGRMIALMEIASGRILAPYLAPNELSVGVGINAKHSAATPPYSKVIAESKYVGREGKLFKFEAVAYDEGGEIGRMEHTRGVIDHARLETSAAKRVKGQGSKM